MARKRSFDYSILLIPVAVLGILVLVQLMSYRYFIRADLTSKQLHSLSEKSINVLERLDGSPLSATAFYSADNPGRERARSIFAEYRDTYPAFEFEIVDPSKNPQLVERFEVGSNGTIVLQYKGRDTKIISREEEAITNGIYQLTQEDSRPVYFLTGHGEKVPGGEYSQLAEALSGERYDVRELLLLREERIPEDAACLVIGGPKEELVDEEVELIADYFENGGNLLVMVDPYRNSGLEDYLGRLGIKLRFDTIVDERSKMMGGDFLFPIVSDYGSHSITNTLDLVTFYPITRSLVIDEEEQPAEVDVRTLARTGPEAWAEMDHEALREGNASFDPDVDDRGPHAVAVAVTRSGQDVEGEGRLVVFGDSDFAGNDYLEISGNKDMVLSTVGWLTREPTLVGIRARNPDHTPVILTEAQSTTVFWLTIVLLPALAAIAGIAVWVVLRWKR